MVSNLGPSSTISQPVFEIKRPSEVPPEQDKVVLKPCTSSILWHTTSVNNLGSESLYFILSTLNKLNIDKIRNNIILKTFPLKV